MSYLETVNQKRQESFAKGEQQRIHAQAIEATVQSSRRITKAISSEAETSRKATYTVKVANPDLAKSDDIAKVVQGISALHTATNAKNDRLDRVADNLATTLLDTISVIRTIDGDLTAQHSNAFSGMAEKLTAVAQELKEARTSSDNEIRDGLQAIVKAVEKLDVQPVVNVPAPTVKVAPTDLQPVRQDLRSLETAVRSIVIPEPVHTDLTEMEKLLEESNKILERITKIRTNVNVSGGGMQQLQAKTLTGGNAYLTAVESQDIPGIYGIVMLNPDGSKISVGTATSTTSSIYDTATYDGTGVFA